MLFLAIGKEARSIDVNINSADKVTDKYGMNGEDGYIIFQAHLMKNMADPQVQHNMAAAMSAVVQKAGIPMQ